MKTKTKPNHTVCNCLDFSTEKSRYVTKCNLCKAAPELLEAAKEALIWLDPDCDLDGVKETEDMSDKEKMILLLYRAIDKEKGK